MGTVISLLVAVILIQFYAIAVLSKNARDWQAQQREEAKRRHPAGKKQQP